MSDKNPTLFDVPLTEIVKIATTFAKNISGETLSALLLLSVLLAVLAAVMFGNTRSERIRLAAFSTVAMFFAGIAFSAIVQSSPPEHTPSEEVLAKEENTKIDVQNEVEHEIVVVPATEATTFLHTAIGPVPHAYGADVLMNAPPFGEVANAAAFQVEVKSGGEYSMEIRLAAAEGRPIDVVVNGELQLERVAGSVTGGWAQSNQQWLEVGQIVFASGVNSLELKSQSVFPHITALRFQN